MRRVILGLAFVTVVLESSWLVLGPPDVSRAIGFFGSAVPTLPAGEAVMTFLAWAAIAAAVGGLLVGVTRAIDRLQLLQQPSARAAILLAVGLLLLVVSVVHHSLASASLCCESGPAALREAIHLAQ